MPTGPGIVMVGTFVNGGTINASVNEFVYGEDAERLAGASAQRWRA